MKIITLFTLVLIVNSNIYAQVKKSSSIKSQTQNLTLDFFCNDNIKIIDNNNAQVEHVQIARWEEAFTLASSPQGFTLKPNFKELDEERFYLEVLEPNVLGDNLTVNLESYDRGDDPLVDSEIDQQIGVVLTRIGNSNNFRSGACLLVVDNDEVDDNFPPPNSNLDGTDDGSDDPTLFAIPGGKMKLTYGNHNRIFDVCSQEPPKEIRVVKLNIISMKRNNGNSTYFSDSEIMSQIDNLQKTWGQCCFRFLDKNGNELETSDIVEMSQPTGVTLDNGLETELTINGTNNVDLTNEEKSLLDSVKDTDSETLDLVFIKNVVDDPNGDGVFTESGVLGYAFPLFIVNISAVEEVYTNTVLITTLRQYFTTPHEIGHILTNKAHYGNEYNGVQESQANLMRDGGTSQFNGVGTSKRLINIQCDFSRTETDLPQIEN